MTAFNTVEMAVLAPMQRASVSSAVMVNAFSFREELEAESQILQHLKIYTARAGGKSRNFRLR